MARGVHVTIPGLENQVFAEGTLRGPPSGRLACCRPTRRKASWDPGHDGSAPRALLAVPRAPRPPIAAVIGHRAQRGRSPTAPPPRAGSPPAGPTEQTSQWPVTGVGDITEHAVPSAWLLTASSARGTFQEHTRGAQAAPCSGQCSGQCSGLHLGQLPFVTRDASSPRSWNPLRSKFRTRPDGKRWQPGLLCGGADDTVGTVLGAEQGYRRQNGKTAPPRGWRDGGEGDGEPGWPENAPP